MKFFIPPAVAIVIVALWFAPRHQMRIGSARLDVAELEAAQIVVEPGIHALRGMNIKRLQECFLSNPDSELRLVGKEQGDDGALLTLQSADGKVMQLHFRFFGDHKFALLDTVVTPAGLQIVDPQPLWGMAHSIILGNCTSHSARGASAQRHVRQAVE